MIRSENSSRASVAMSVQYSIWPAGRDIPAGWQEAGKTGPKAECLAYIKEVWTDMRPLSVRKSQEERRRKQLEGEK